MKTSDMPAVKATRAAAHDRLSYYRRMMGMPGDISFECPRCTPPRTFAPYTGRDVPFEPYAAPGTFEDRVRALSDPEHNAALDHAKRVYNTHLEGKFTTMDDAVNHPPHYTQDADIECIDAIEAALGEEGFVAFLRGQVLKYSWRQGRKGSPVENARKGLWYQQRLVGALRAAADYGSGLEDA